MVATKLRGGQPSFLGPSILSLSAKGATFPLTALASLGSSFLIIRATDAGLYARILLLGTLFQLIPFADLGVGAAVTNRAGASVTRVDRHKLMSTLIAAIRVLLAVACAIAAISVI